MRKTLWLVAVVLAVAVQVQAGVTLKYVTRTEGGRAERRPQQPMTSTLMAEGDKARMEMAGAQGQAQGPMEGGYILVHNGGDLMYMVSPKEKTYMVWTMDQMLGMAGSAMQMMQGMMTMKVTDPKIERLLDEKGPDMFGMPTRHYKFRMTYTMETSVFGMKSSTGTVREEEIWTTTKLADKGLNVWKRRSQTFKLGNEELEKLANTEMSKVEGLPLKQVSVTVSTPSQGAPTTSRTEMEVVDVKEGAIASDLLELPAGYTEMKMPTMEDVMKQAQQAQQSAAAEAGVEGQPQVPPTSPVQGGQFPRFPRRGQRWNQQ